MATDPEVSVVIGLRSVASSAATAIDSVLTQEGVALEVILVDDGSIDATPALLADYVAKDARVRVLTQPALGLTRALVAGCAAARGTFIARQDAGPRTRWLPGRLARTVEVLRTRPDVVLVACGARLLSPRGEFVAEHCPSEAGARAGLAALDIAEFAGPTHSAVTFRRKAYEAVGGYREVFRLAQDADLWLRLLETGAFGMVEEVLVERGLSPDGSSGAYGALQRQFAAIALEAAARRRSGESEAAPVAQAAELAGRVPDRPTRRGRAQGRYFLGACLRHRDPRAAHRWFAEAVRTWPLDGRAWFRWLTTSAGAKESEFEHQKSERDVLSADLSGVGPPSAAALYRTISIVIPTWRREAVLIDTVTALLALPRRADEIVIVDQTRRHGRATDAALAAWVAAGRVRLVRRGPPSLPAALNHGFRVARGDIVLCLDDDIVPSAALVEAHLEAHRSLDPGIVAGRVLQPWDVPPQTTTPRPGPFTGTSRAFISEFMGGNFSAPRREMIALGGFDERFVKVAYRNESELSTRLFRARRRILFEPRAEIRHLQAPAGGVRAWVGGVRTARPAHAVGEYYFLLRSRPNGWVGRFVARPWRHVRTRDNLRRPWRIPMTLGAEIAGMFWALSLYTRGPRLLRLEAVDAAPFGPAAPPFEGRGA